MEFLRSIGLKLNENSFVEVLKSITLCESLRRFNSYGSNDDDDDDDDDSVIQFTPDLVRTRLDYGRKFRFLHQIGRGILQHWI